MSSVVKTINSPDMWCCECGNHALEVSGAELLPIYTCTKCKSMMWSTERPSIEQIREAAHADGPPLKRERELRSQLAAVTAECEKFHIELKDKFPIGRAIENTVNHYASKGIGVRYGKLILNASDSTEGYFVDAMDVEQITAENENIRAEKIGLIALIEGQQKQLDETVTAWKKATAECNGKWFEEISQFTEENDTLRKQNQALRSLIIEADLIILHSRSDLFDYWQSVKAKAGV